MIQLPPGQRRGKGSGLRLQQCAAWNRDHMGSEDGEYHLVGGLEHEFYFSIYWE